MKKCLFHITGICAIMPALCAFMHCSSPTTTSTDTATFTSYDSAGSQLMTNGRFLLLYPGDTAVFLGTRHCSTAVGGRLQATSVDSVRYQTITHSTQWITVDDSDYAVYPQQQEFGAVCVDSQTYWVTRYFERTGSDVRQRAYRDAYGLCVPVESMVMPETLIIGNNWPAGPILPFAVDVGNAAVEMDGYGFAEKAMESWQHGIYGYGQGVMVVFYYSLNGEGTQGGEAVCVSGTITIRSRLIKDVGMLTSEITTRIQQTQQEGRAQLRIEHIYLERSGGYVLPFPE